MLLDDKIEKIRSDFPYLDEKNMGRKIIYLDNSATSQKPISVIKTVEEYYKYENANPHQSKSFPMPRVTQCFRPLIECSISNRI